jgi:ABC-type dipeptide/oligopeptide/nickel transport system permease component
MVGDDILGEEGASRGLIRGDLGMSLFFRNQPVTDVIKDT